MVLPVVTFTDPRLAQPIQPHGLNLALQKGLGFAQQLQKMKQAAAMAPLQRQLEQAQIAQAPLKQQYLAGQIAQQPVQQKLLEAQAKMNLAHALQLQAAAKSPFGGKILPGAAGRRQGLMMLRNAVGEKNPDYQAALKDYNAVVRMKMSKSDYYEANLIFKNKPVLDKLQTMENYNNENAARQRMKLPPLTFPQWYQQRGYRPEQVASQANIPTSPVAQATRTPVTTTSPTPQEQTVAGTQQVQPGTATTAPQPLIPHVTAQPAEQQVAPTIPASPTDLTTTPYGQQGRQLGVALNKQSMYQFQQQKMAYAANIRKTYKRMPEQAITAYSQNPIKLANDYRKSLHGKITPDYKNYLTFSSNAKILATQARQFYGDTIQPSMLKRLDDMTNPISWRTSPKAALINYHAVKNTLFREMDTYTDEVTDPQFYEKQRESKVLRGVTPHGTQPMQPKRVGVKTKDLSKLSNAELLNMYKKGKY